MVLNGYAIAHFKMMSIIEFAIDINDLSSQSGGKKKEKKRNQVNV